MQQPSGILRRETRGVDREGTGKIQASGRDSLSRIRCIGRAARESREGDARRSPQTRHIPLIENGAWNREDPRCAVVTHRSNTVSFFQQTIVLVLFRSGDRHAKLIGLGAHSGRRLGQSEDSTDSRVEPKLQSYSQTHLQRSGHDGDRPYQGRPLVPTLPGAARRRHETQPGQAHHRPANCLYCIVDMEIRGGVRPEKAEPHDITFLGVVSITGEEVSLQWRRTGRRDGYRGEHPSNFWSWINDPESPRIGYAPLESRIKRWARESPIEGWFLLLSRERQGFAVNRDAIVTLMRDHLKSRRPWISPQISWVSLCTRSADQLFRPAGADAGCKTMCTKRGENVCLYILPHRRKFDFLSRCPRGRAAIPVLKYLHE